MLYQILSTIIQKVLSYDDQNTNKVEDHQSTVLAYVLLSLYDDKTVAYQEMKKCGVINHL